MKTPNGGRKGSGLKPPVVSGIRTPKAVKPSGNGTPVIPDERGQKSGSTMDWFKQHLGGKGMPR